MRAEIKGKKRVIPSINETKNWFFEGISEIDKFLSKLTNRKRENFKLLKSEMKFSWPFLSDCQLSNDMGTSY